MIGGCPDCGKSYQDLPGHLQICQPKRVKVWIFSPEYECPDHYNWSSGPLSEATFGNYNKYRYVIPLDQYKRWQEIQDAWEQMNEEMHQLTGKV
jgi:hypothetical protein